MTSFDCFHCFKTYQCFPTFDDIVFDLSIRKIANNITLQVLNTQLKETIHKFQTTLRSKTSVLVFIEKSISNRAHLAIQLLQLVAIGSNVTLYEEEVPTYTVPTIHEISPTPFVVKQITSIESPNYNDVLLKEYYFRRVRILKQIGVFTSLMLTILVPTIKPEQLHQFVTVGEIHQIYDNQKYTGEQESQTSQQ